MAINWDAPIEIRDGRNGNWFWVDKAIWTDIRLTSSDKALYGTLAYFANQKTQTAFPSIIQLQDMSGLSRRQTYYSIKRLEKYQHLFIERKHGKPNKYTLLDNGINHLKEQGGATIAPVQSTQQGGAKSTLQGVQNKTTNNNIYNKRLSINIDNGETPKDGDKNIKKIEGFGNPNVKRIIEEFSQITGLSKSVDIKPQWWAYNFARSKSMGVDKFRPCLEYLIKKWGGRVEVTKIEQVFRHFPEYEAEVLNKPKSKLPKVVELTDDGYLLVGD